MGAWCQHCSLEACDAVRVPNGFGEDVGIRYGGGSCVMRANGTNNHCPGAILNKGEGRTRANRNSIRSRGAVGKDGCGERAPRMTAADPGPERITRPSQGKEQRRSQAVLRPETSWWPSAGMLRVKRARRCGHAVPGRNAALVGSPGASGPGVETAADRPGRPPRNPAWSTRTKKSRLAQVTAPHGNLTSCALIPKPLPVSMGAVSPREALAFLRIDALSRFIVRRVPRRATFSSPVFLLSHSA